MRLLLVDHDDSFTNNLLDFFHSSFPKIDCVNHRQLREIKNLKKYAACVFSAGPGHPSQYVDSIDFYLNLPEKMPFLGVCLGHQIMLYAHGGRIQRIGSVPEHGRQIQLRRTHLSRFLPQNAFQSSFVLYNSLGCFSQDRIFQSTFRSLYSERGVCLVAEHTCLPHIGVQFHPESFASRGGEHFLRCFVHLILGK